jgi:AcrR family transcriptional regulator
MTTADGAAPPVGRPRNRKAQIVRAATELFHANGYDRVGIKDVASSVGITGPALYRHFQSKQALLRAVVFDGLDRWAELNAADRARSGPPAQLLESQLEDHAREAVERREFGSLWQRESRHLAKGDQVQAEVIIRDLAESTASRIAASRPGLSTSDAELLGWAVLSVGASLSYHRVSLAGPRLERMTFAAMRQIARTRLPRQTAGRTDARVPQRCPAPTRATRREALLAAAADLFDARGYQPVSMEEIGAAAGVAAPSVYRHFVSKAELLYAILIRGGEVLHMSVSQALAASQHAADALDRVARAYIAMVVEGPALFGVLIREVGSLPDPMRDEVLRVQRRYIAEWVRLLREVRPDLPDAEARVLTYGVFSVVTDTARTPRLHARPNIEAELHAIALRLLRTPSEG